MWLAPLLLCLAPQAEAPLLHAGERIELALSAEARSLRFESAFAGTLHVWATSSECHPVLHLEDENGKQLAEDDNSGGNNAACIAFEVERGRKLRIRVASAKRGESGKGLVCAQASPETEVTRAAAQAAHAQVSEIKRLQKEQQFEPARALLEQTLRALLSTEGAGTSDGVAAAAIELGQTAEALSALEQQRRAWTFVLDQGLRTLPPDSPGLQTVRGNLANALGESGELQQARELYAQVLEVDSRTLPADHIDLQRARINLARIIKALGDATGARELEEQALEVFTRTLPDDDLDLQRLRGNLAGTRRMQGDLHGALELFQKVHDVFERTLPADHPYLQFARINLAVGLKELGDLEGARPLEEQVLKAFEHTLPADHPNLQLARQNYGTTLRGLGDLAQARKLQEQVLEVRTRTLPPDHADLQLARTSLAQTLRQLGDTRAALPLQEQVLEVYARTLPADDLALLSTRVELADIIAELGDLQRSRAQLEPLIAQLSSTLPPDHPLLLGAKDSLGCTLRELGDLQGARLVFEEVLEVRSRTLPEGHHLLQSSRSHLGAVLFALHDLPAARALFESAVEQLRRALPPDARELQGARRDVALVLHVLGDYAGARTVLEEVLAVQLRTLSADDPELQLTRLGLASTLKELGDLRAAIALEQQALQVSSRTQEQDAAVPQVVRQNLARSLALLRAQGPDRPSDPAYQVAISEFSAELRHDLGAALLSPSRREAEERAANGSESLSAALSFACGLGRYPDDPTLEREALVIAETRRGVGLSWSRLSRAASSDPAFRNVRQNLQSSAAELARLAEAGSDHERLTRARAKHDAAEHEFQALAQRSSGPAQVALEFDPAAVGAQLEKDTALVSFLCYERQVLAQGQAPVWSKSQDVCAFVLRPNCPLARVELGSLVAIQAAVVSGREAIGARPERGRPAGAGARAENDRLSAELRRRVFDPLLPALGDARHLIVVLDDVLHLVPLDALPAAGDELLGDTWRIETRASLLELQWPHAHLAGDGALLALGNPDFDGRPDARTQPQDQLAGVGPRSSREAVFTTLPGTRAEVHGIADYFCELFGEHAEAHVLERAAASCERLVALAPQARWLHVATHGWFAPESIRSWEDPEPVDKLSRSRAAAGRRGDQSGGMSPMLLCGLALAGANRPQDELGRVTGLITAEELATLDLSNCELAVLSACDTNVGEARAGMGVASLQRALQIAGARSVITSLWKVPDEATKELMLDFYRRLWIEKEPKWQALWEAKKKLRAMKDESGKPKYTTRDWAAWVLTGEPD